MHADAMHADAVLIIKPHIDFKTLLGLSSEALGYNPAEKSDAGILDVSDVERFISALAAIRDQKSPAGLIAGLLTHVSFSVFLACEERDMIDVLQSAAAMSFVVADTVARGVQVAVISGTLAQWRDAVSNGSTLATEGEVRLCFNRIHSLFEGAGLDVWTDFRVRPAPDKTFYLEDKRNC